MLKIDYPFKKTILACGTQTPAGFCLTKKNCAYLVNDFGCLDEQGVWERYQKEIMRVQKELKIKPKLITHDLNPTYSLTKYAQSLSRPGGLPCLAVQHHHAHLASCWAENNLAGPVIGVVFDGPAYGEDAHSWGGEFFLGDLRGFKRVGHLQYTPILSCNQSRAQAGEKAASYLYQAFGQDFADLPIDFIQRGKKEEWLGLTEHLAKAVRSSAASTLFDAVCALVGLREHLEYEDQGIVELGRIVNRSSHAAGKIYDFKIQRQQDKFLVELQPIFHNIVQDLSKKVSKSIISAALHNTLIEIVHTVCKKIRQKEKIKQVILAGIVFQNKFLLNRLKDLLTQDGFQLSLDGQFSGKDSNISFGQAVLANAD